MFNQFAIIMWIKYTSLIVIIEILSFKFEVSQSVEGDGCDLDFGRTGKCTQVNKCPEAIKQIRNRGYPKLCSFEGDLAIICCETISLRSSIQFGSIARKKCDEYAIRSITTTTTTTTTTTPSTPFHKVYHTVGGVHTFPLEFPHMAILGYGNPDNNKWSCGGSLISENFVLTAAHCIHTRHGTVQIVKLGVHKLNFVHKYEESFNVKNLYLHPDYVHSQYYHDIALIELDHPANIQSGVKPACLQTLKEVPGSLLIGTGWGAVEFDGSIYNTLQKVFLSYVSNDACAPYYEGKNMLTNGTIDDWQVCADGGGTIADTCQGDSGGPLQFKSDSKSLYTIIGITSLGIKCSIVPGVYTRVSHYVPWIENIVWPEESKLKPRVSH